MEGGLLLWGLAKADLVVSGKRDAMFFNKEKRDVFLDQSPR